MLVENVIDGFAALCGISIVVVWILLIIAAKRLSFAKAYGIRQRETCGNEYLELETARYEIDQMYKSSVDNLLKTSNIILQSVCLIPIIVSIVILGFASKHLNTKPRTLIILAGSGCAVLAIFGVYLAFWIKELLPSTEQKYLTMYNIGTQPVGNKLKVLGFSIGIIVVLWISVVAYKHVSSTIDMNQWSNDNEMYQRIAIMFSIITVVCAAILFLIHGDRPLLQQKILGKYGDIKSKLQSSVTDLMDNPDFRRYLEINIKRVNPSMDGNPDFNDATLKENLYAYLEHRPGIDRFDVGKEYITVGTMKPTFNEMFDTATTNDRHALLVLLQKMYAMEVDALYIFTPEQIDACVNHKYLFQESPTVASTLATNIKQTNLSYEGIATFLKSFTLSGADATPENVDKIKYLLHWLVHMSTYKDDVAIEYETIDYYLSTDNTLSTDAINQLKVNMAALEKEQHSSTVIASLGVNMRSARAVEPEIVLATDTFLKHVFRITMCICAVLAYLGLHWFYINYKSSMVTALSMTILIGIFVITWYAWFYVKLNL